MVQCQIRFLNLKGENIPIVDGRKSNYSCKPVTFISRSRKYVGTKFFNFQCDFVIRTTIKTVYCKILAIQRPSHRCQSIDGKNFALINRQAKGRVRVSIFMYAVYAESNMGRRRAEISSIHDITHYHFKSLDPNRLTSLSTSPKPS